MAEEHVDGLLMLVYEPMNSWLVPSISREGNTIHDLSPLPRFINLKLHDVSNV
jgi:hypothetical protein